MKKFMIIAIISILLISCDEDPVSPKSNYSIVNKNPFIGTWVQVFDTLGDSKHSKEQKLTHWYIGDFSGWLKPDTMRFVNDSVFNFHQRYWYDEKKIHITDLKQYETIKYDTIHLHYYFPSNDSMYYYLDSIAFDTGYFPVYIRMN